MADQYDSSDAARYRPVDLVELDGLVRASARPVVRDVGKLVHLLTRMRNTLAANAETITGLHRHIEQQKGHLARVGQATTLNPLDALKYLDDTQRDLLFDRISRDRLAMLRHMVTQAQNTREDLVGQLEQVRSAATSMAQRADLPPDVRVEFTRLLSYLPSEVREVHVPPLLDYPDLPPADPAGAPELPPPRRRSSAPSGPDPDPDSDPDRGFGHGSELAVESGTGSVLDPAPGAGSESAQSPSAVTFPSAAPGPPVQAEPAAVPVYRDPYAPPPVETPGAAPEVARPAYVDPHATVTGAPAYCDPWAAAPSSAPTTVERDDVDDPPPPVRRDPRPPPDLDTLGSLFS